MAQRLGVLLVLGVALAATSGYVRKAAAGRTPGQPMAAKLTVAARPDTTRACPIPHRFLAAYKYAAKETRIPLPLLYAFTWVESHLDPDARSSAGAHGIAQLMPSTARAVGTPDYDDPASNIVGGARYLRLMLKRFNDVDLALAAYNAGPTAVAEAGRAPNDESVSYVANVREVWRDELPAVLTC
jgi:soluble lytic murein transglycosylase-like protein